jgi:hypothetical protein
MQSQLPLLCGSTGFFFFFFGSADAVKIVLVVMAVVAAIAQRTITSPQTSASKKKKKTLKVTQNNPAAPLLGDAKKPKEGSEGVCRSATASFAFLSALLSFLPPIPFFLPL